MADCSAMVGFGVELCRFGTWLEVDGGRGLDGDAVVLARGTKRRGVWGAGRGEVGRSYRESSSKSGKPGERACGEVDWDRVGTDCEVECEVDCSAATPCSDEEFDECGAELPSAINENI